MYQLTFDRNVFVNCAVVVHPQSPLSINTALVDPPDVRQFFTLVQGGDNAGTLPNTVAVGIRSSAGTLTDAWFSIAAFC